MGGGDRSGDADPTLLRSLLAPSSIAIVGLSSSPGKHGRRVLENLRRLGYPGTVWGVNPRLPTVAGVEVFPSLSALPAAPDLVVSAVPAAATPPVVEEAGRAGAGAMVVFAGGFSESGSEGRRLQEEMAVAARRHAIRVLGPNSGGVIRPSARLAVSFLTCLDRPREQIRSGRVGLVTQSGGTGSYIHNLAAARGGGLAVSISTGNEADLGVADGIRLAASLEEVDVIALVVETVRDGEAFISAVHAARSAGKPVVACRIGRSERARRIVSTHTGAMALPSRVLEGVLASLGVGTAATPAELLDVAEVVARAGEARGDRVGVVAHSGGIAILLADLADQSGLSLPSPGEELRRRVQPLLQEGSPNNPLDMGGIIAGPGRFAEVVGAFADAGSHDVVLAVSTAHPPAHTAERVEGLLALDPPVPVIHLWMAGDQGAEGLARLREAEAPVTEEPRAAIRAVEALILDLQTPSIPRPVDAAAQVLEADPLTEHQAKRMLAGWGLPVPHGQVATTGAEAAEIAEQLGGVLVVKVSSPDLQHKTEVGGVRLDVEGAAAARRAYEEVVAAAAASDPGLSIEGALLERQVRGTELVVGCVRDPIFGPLVMVGLGGVAVEALSGPSFAPAPLDVAGAGALVRRAPGLVSVLGRAGVDEQGLGDLHRIVSEVSRRFEASAWSELEINPLVWSGKGWWVLDALVKP